MMTGLYFQGYILPDRPMKPTEKLVNDLLATMGIAPSEATPDADFIKDLVLDSLDMADLIIQMENKAKVQIPTEDWEKMRTVAEAVEYLEVRIAETAAGTIHDHAV